MSFLKRKLYLIRLRGIHSYSWCMDKTIDQLIAVQALTYSQKWSTFLQLITPAEIRKILVEYEKRRDKLEILVTNSLFILAEISEDDQRDFNENLEIYLKPIKHDNNNNDLMKFLDVAQPILAMMDKMEEYRRALDTAKIKPYLIWNDDEDDLPVCL